MKKAFFILLLILAAAYVAFGQMQCADDTLETIIDPYDVGIDSLHSQPLPCYPYTCKATGCNSWQLPPLFTGHLEISTTGIPMETVNIQIIEGCHLVRLDTCVSINSALSWNRILALPANSQIRVCGGNIEVRAYVKVGPSTDTLESAIFDTDTLCGVLMHQAEPIKPWKWAYFDPFTLEKVTNLQPNKAYLRRKTWD